MTVGLGLVSNARLHNDSNPWSKFSQLWACYPTLAAATGQLAMDRRNARLAPQGQLVGAHSVHGMESDTELLE